MAKRTILTEDDPCLYKKCRKVEKFDEKLAQLLDDMAETLKEAEGVGLAAPQIGILKRVFIIDYDNELIELVNPTIMEQGGEQGDFEGCLSFPGKSGYVVRPNFVRVRGYNRRGELMEYEGEGIFARAVLHENDHINGEVFLRLITEPPEGFGEDKQ